MGSYVEESECGRNKFHLKLTFERKQGWFPRLMEAVHGLGFDVTEANVITVEGTVMNR